MNHNKSLMISCATIASRLVILLLLLIFLLRLLFFLFLFVLTSLPHPDHRCFCGWKSRTNDMQIQSMVYWDSSLKELSLRNANQFVSTTNVQPQLWQWMYFEICIHIGPHALLGWLPDFLPDSNCKNDRITERNQFENSTVDEQFFPKNPWSCPGKKKIVVWNFMGLGIDPSKMSILLGIVSLYPPKQKSCGLKYHSFRWMFPVSTSQKGGENESC